MGASPSTRKYLLSPRAKLELAQRRGADPLYFKNSHIYVPEYSWEAGQGWDLGGVSLELVALPGHYAGQLGIYIPQSQALGAADGVEDPLPFLESPAAWAQQLATLKVWQGRNLRSLYPAHAQSWSLGPFDPQAGGVRLLAANLRYFEYLENYWLAGAGGRRGAEWSGSKLRFLESDEAWERERQGEEAKALEAWEASWGLNWERVGESLGLDLSAPFYQRAHHLAVQGSWRRRRGI